MALPPVKSKQNPVENEFSSLAINAIVAAISESSPHLCIGILDVIIDTCDSGIAATIGVLITAGAMLFIVIPAFVLYL